MQKRLKSMLGIVQSLAFLGVLLAPLTSLSHPLKLSASLIEFDPEAKTLRMECKVFRDDFERSLDSVLKGIDPNTIKKEEKAKIIETYFNQHYVITFNKKVLPLKLESSKYLRDFNVLVFRFEPHSMMIKEGDTLTIKNTLLFAEFGYAQTNRVAVRIPPFSIKDGHVTTIADYEITYSF